ncbi:putative ABC transporter substrate-binding protein [Sphingomonas changbaiensis NBRC 104936]|uniref:Putative ABC transporter substrate-binding protein n=1 Tax=Sphingomonas changbaiensis NBRC 104936 TaxID=1219043 RepID=A0A0E9MLQ1_9SPHN|nr:ABC transporter substrate-binding protein [Sphingomonas changbaiensis]GAO38060.1 putative ABC transporter substrate-binding protein [Sphingomonas changbaiensis NBRC 104936]
MKRWLLPLLLLASCEQASDQGPIRVSVIGGPPTLVDPNRKTPDESERVLLGAVAETLVSFDEDAQIGPALAQRWIVTSDGLSAIFRLRNAIWPNGKAVTSEEVARRARAIIAPNSRNPLRDAFDSIEEINPTTPDVIEFRLTTPRPPLLELLAQPESSILSRAMGATGPYQVDDRDGNTVNLTARVKPAEGSKDPRLPNIRLTGERAALAVARFTTGNTDLVLGGTYLSWPLVQAAQPSNRAIRIDPAEGLFGLSVVKSKGWLADPVMRQVLGMVIDRDALLDAFKAPGWLGALAVLPQRYRSAADPAFPPWASFDITGRIAEAQRRVQAWHAAHPGPLQVRLYLTPGPGSTLLYGQLAADWRRVGIETIRVTDAAESDLRVVDAVAPAGSALWYLDTLACPSADACSEEALDALDRARNAQSLLDRSVQLATADRLLANSGLYVPLTRPLRWSLVSPRLNQFKENARAYHPLAYLRRPDR